VENPATGSRREVGHHYKQPALAASGNRFQNRKKTKPGEIFTGIEPIAFHDF